MGFDRDLAAACALALIALAIAGVTVQQRTRGLLPAPTTRDGSASGQREAGGATRDHAQPEQQLRPTVAAPAVPTDTDRNPAQHQREAPREDKPKTTDWIQAGSAFFTLLATFALVWIGHNQRKISADQAKITAGQRDIAAEQATISKAQADIQQAVADLERPTLFVTRLGPVEFRPLGVDTSNGTERCEPVVRMHFANYGRTPAVLLAVEGDILLARKPPAVPLGPRMKTQLSRFQIMATGEDKSAAVLIVGHPVPAVIEGYFRARQMGALVRGRFVYRDPFGVRLETGFELVPGEGGEPLPGNYVGNNYYRTWDADAPDAPHRGYGA